MALQYSYSQLMNPMTIPVKPSSSMMNTQLLNPKSSFYSIPKIAGTSTAITPTYQAPSGSGGGTAPVTTQSNPSPGPSPEPQVDPYSGVYSELDRMIGWLPNEQSRLEKSIGDIAISQQGEINTAGDAQLAKFPGYRQDVENKQAASLQDLAGNIRNMLRAGDVYLGARGAGDSSATGMYSFALNKEANKQRTSIRNQAMSMFNEVNMKESDVKSAVDEQLNQVNTWKATQLANLANDFSNRQQSLMSAKANVRQQAVEYWLNQLSTIEQQAMQYGTTIQNWATERLAQLNNYKIQLGQMGSFSPQDITQQEISPLTSANTDAYSSEMNPYFNLLKKKQAQSGLFS